MNVKFLAQLYVPSEVCTVVFSLFFPRNSNTRANIPKKSVPGNKKVEGVRKSNIQCYLLEFKNYYAVYVLQIPFKITFFL